LAIAAPMHGLATLGRAVLRIEDSLPPADSPPSSPVPHLLATLRFGESVELAIVGLPIAEEIAPLWPLALPGTAAVIRLDRGDVPALEAACGAAEVPIVHASDLLGWVEEADPVQVAALLRLTLEQVAGG